MTTTGWLEIVLFAGIVGLLTRPLGGYLQRVYSGEPTLLRPLLAPIENALYRLAGVKPDGEQDWLQIHHLFSDLPCPRHYRPLRVVARPIRPAAQSDESVGASSGPGAEHGRQLHHQHQLAVLRRRDDTELL